MYALVVSTLCDDTSMFKYSKENCKPLLDMEIGANQSVIVVKYSKENCKKDLYDIYCASKNLSNTQKRIVSIIVTTLFLGCSAPQILKREL